MSGGIGNNVNPSVGGPDQIPEFAELGFDLDAALAEFDAVVEEQSGKLPADSSTPAKPEGSPEAKAGGQNVEASPFTPKKPLPQIPEQKSPTNPWQKGTVNPEVIKAREEGKGALEAQKAGQPAPTKPRAWQKAEVSSAALALGQPVSPQRISDRGSVQPGATEAPSASSAVAKGIDSLARQDSKNATLRRSLPQALGKGANTVGASTGRPRSLNGLAELAGRAKGAGNEVVSFFKGLLKGGVSSINDRKFQKAGTNPSNQQESVSIGKALKELSNAGNSDENVRAIKNTLNQVKTLVSRMGASTLKESDSVLYQTGSLEANKIIKTLKDALQEVKWAKGEIKENESFAEIKQLATELNQQLPDTVRAISFCEMKANVENVAKFYEGSNALYNAMAQHSSVKEEFKENVEFKGKLAQDNVTKNIPTWQKNLTAAETPEDRSKVMSSPATRGLTEGVGAESTTLIENSTKFLDKMADSEEKTALKSEIAAIAATVKKAIKEGHDADPWTRQQAGDVDLFGFQARMAAFVQSQVVIDKALEKLEPVKDILREIDNPEEATTNARFGTPLPSGPSTSGPTRPNRPPPAPPTDTPPYSPRTTTEE